MRLYEILSQHLVVSSLAHSFRIETSIEYPTACRLREGERGISHKKDALRLRVPGPQQATVVYNHAEKCLPWITSTADPALRTDSYSGPVSPAKSATPVEYVGLDPRILQNHMKPTVKYMRL